MNIEALAREAGAFRLAQVTRSESGETHRAPAWVFTEDSGALTRFAALIRAQALEESHKTARLWADECDDLADHTDDHTCAGLRRLASDMRAAASLA